MYYILNNIALPILRQIISQGSPPAGNITVNDVAVSEAEELSDGTLLYTLSGLLFDHLDRLQEATDLLLNQSSVFSHLSPGD